MAGGDGNKPETIKAAAAAALGSGDSGVRRMERLGAGETPEVELRRMPKGAEGERSDEDPLVMLLGPPVPVLATLLVVLLGPPDAERGVVSGGDRKDPFAFGLAVTSMRNVEYLFNRLPDPPAASLELVLLPSSSTSPYTLITPPPPPPPPPLRPWPIAPPLAAAAAEAAAAVGWPLGSLMSGGKRSRMLSGTGEVLASEAPTLNTVGVDTFVM